MFGKFPTGQYDFNLIPLKQHLKHGGPVCGCHPQTIKTNQRRDVLLWGSVFSDRKESFLSFILKSLISYGQRRNNVFGNIELRF